MARLDSSAPPPKPSAVRLPDSESPAGAATAPAPVKGPSTVVTVLLWCLGAVFAFVALASNLALARAQFGGLPPEAQGMVMGAFGFPNIIALAICLLVRRCRTARGFAWGLVIANGLGALSACGRLGATLQ